MTWDIITAGTPAPITGRNAAAAIRSRSLSGAFDTTVPSWLSARPPWPGKCLAVAAFRPVIGAGVPAVMMSHVT
ncbi:MAG TPA: hypothetical protein VNT52_08095, partial [Acidimicrobiales bacterium]|nr:hypothetical protein [Acidimicrobiales bacterium]